VTDPARALVLVGLGGAGGAVARHVVGLRIEGRGSVLAVNTLGSLTLGALLAAPIGSEATFLAVVGFCGAFTTFSSFAVETVSTAADGGSNRGRVRGRKPGGRGAGVPRRRGGRRGFRLIGARGTTGTGASGSYQSA